MKKILKLILCLLLVTTITCGCINKKNITTKKNKTENKGENIPNGIVLNDYKGSEFAISDMAIVYDNNENISTFTGEVKNITKNKITFNILKIKLYNTNGTKVNEVMTALGKQINPGQTKKFTIKVTSDIRTSSYIKYEIID